MKNEKKIYNPELAAVCYFRTIAEYPYRKALLQITEKCNMHCEHCFVSSTCKGNEMSYDEIENKVLPALIEAKVTKVTLTGGEPMIHPDITKIIHLLVKHRIRIGICTNASLITSDFLEEISDYPYIHFNVSLDGFSNESHGRFRGNTSKKLFEDIIENIKKLSSANRLQGILVTPNQYTQINEYAQICKFAKEVHAKYVLMNPLSEFGRGQDSQNLAYTQKQMEELRAITQVYNDETLEIVYIRFPDKNKSLGPCAAGKILYVFTNGDIAYCPYMVFAASDKISKYKPSDFIIGNIYSKNCKIDDFLQSFNLPVEKKLNIDCSLQDACEKGCNAAKISHGLLISDCDIQMCPITKKEVD